jgi:hypothetical protein
MHFDAMSEHVLMLEVVQCDFGPLYYKSSDMVYTSVHYLLYCNNPEIFHVFNFDILRESTSVNKKLYRKYANLTSCVIRFELHDIQSDKKVSVHLMITIH